MFVGIRGEGRALYSQEQHARARHRNEIETFGAAVVDDEVSFVSCPWRSLLDAWAVQPDGRIRAHVEAVTARFSP